MERWQRMVATALPQVDGIAKHGHPFGVIQIGIRVPVGFILMPRSFSVASIGFQNHEFAVNNALRFNAKQLRGEVMCILEIGRFPEFGKCCFWTE